VDLLLERGFLDLGARKANSLIIELKEGLEERSW